MATVPPTPPTGATDRTPDSSDQWITAAEAAALEGITTRAAQRRAAAGKYEAKRVETQQGEQWLINPATLKGRPTTPTDATDSPDPKADSTPDRHPDRRDPDPDAPTRKEVEKLESEVAFLRGLVEQRDRDAAELRAALREALRAMPKQLGEGAPAVLQPPTVTGEPDAPSASKTPDRARKREPRPFWKIFLGIR